MKRFVCSVLQTALVLIPVSLFGASITGTVEGQADGAAWNSFGSTQSCSYGFSSSITSGSCTYVSTGLINGGPWFGQANSYTADVYSSIDLTTGSLHAYAGQGFTNFPIDTKFSDSLPASTLADADAVATVGDTLTFQAPGQAVPMQIQFKIAVDGILKSFESVETGGYAELDYGSGFSTQASFFDEASGGTVYTTPVETVNSSTYNFFLTLTANSEIACGAGANFTHLCSATESSDFSDTAQIVGIVLDDMNDKQLNGYTVSSSSGINYDSLLAGDPNAAPEPATWTLVGGALLVVGLTMRRRVTAGVC